MKIWAALILAILSTSSWCEEVIDLGSIEIDGETRRPMISYSESSQNVVKAMTHQLSSNAHKYANNLKIENAAYPVAEEFIFSPVQDYQSSLRGQ
jgi:hypothetical protein